MHYFLLYYFTDRFTVEGPDDFLNMMAGMVFRGSADRNEKGIFFDTTKPHDVSGVPEELRDEFAARLKAMGLVSSEDPTERTSAEG